MPRVAGTPGRTVALQPLGAPRAVAVSDAPGLAVAGQALGQVADVSEKFQIEHDIWAAKSVDTRFRQAVLDAGMGEGGYYTLAGENAVRAHEGYGKTIEKLRREAIDALGTGRAGRIATDEIEGFYLAEQARSTQHYRRELSTAQDETSKARMGLAAAEGVAFYNDEPRFKKALETIAYETLEQGQRAGASEETIAAAIMGAQSKLIQSAITSARERDPRDALVLFSKYQNRLDAGTRAAVSSEVFEAARKISAIEISEQLLARGGSQQAQLAAVREIEDDELRDSVRVRVNQFWTDQRAGREAAERELDAETTRLVVSGRIRNPEDLPTGLTGSARRALVTLIGKQAKGEDLAPDPARYRAWRTMPDAELAKQEPNAAWKLALGPYFDDFTKDVGRARTAVEGRAAKKQLTPGAINDQIDLFARSIGVYATPSDSDEKNATHLAFDNYVRLELQRFEDPGFEDLRGVLQQATRRYTVGGGDFFSLTGPGLGAGRERFGFELAPEDVPNVELTDADREAARAHLVGQGTAPTDEAIDALFREFLGSAAGGR